MSPNELKITERLISRLRVEPEDPDYEQHQTTLCIRSYSDLSRGVA